MIAFVAGLIGRDNFPGDLFGKPVMHKVYKRFNILDRQATHPLFTFLDQIGQVGQFLIGQTRDPLDKICAVFGKMVRDRRETKML